MAFVRAGQLARFTPTARPDDPLGLVAENLRESPYGAIPVTDRLLTGDGRADAAEDNARVLGLVDERDLARVVLPALSHQEATISGAIPLGGVAGTPSTPASVFEENVPGSNGFANGAAGLNGYGVGGHDPVDRPQPVPVTELTVRDVMRTNTGFVPAAFTLHNALLALDRYGSLALPVVDEAGRYRGMISRADVVAALGGQVRPPLVGGMATPLGVWLTTGHVSGGAPPLGLFLSGMVLALCFVVAHLVMLLGLTALNREWGVMFVTGRLGMTSEVGNSFNLIVTLLQYLVFLLTMRALPLSGTHAAEHQTVWAIERGVPLTPEYVARMPRAHPRCGTNLVALVVLAQIIFQHLPEINAASVLLSLLFVYLTWRNFGGVLQEWFTTRPASPKQLESGIKAGRALLEKYQEQPQVTVSFGARLFNSGLILSALGMFIVLISFSMLEMYLARWILGL